MGHRTHIGIADKNDNVQFVYGHWNAPLYSAGADILIDELDVETYQLLGVKPLSEFSPDLHIECAYLLPFGGEWLYARTHEAWQPLTKEAVNASFESTLQGYKNIATGKHYNSRGHTMPARPDYWRYYDNLQIRHSQFMESDASPLSAFSEDLQKAKVYE